MLYRIIFLSGPRTGERVTVTEQAMTVGRDADCAVVLDDPEVARRHAEFAQKDEELFIRDLGSMNRILVNKREVREARLKHGDELELGRTRLVVQALVQAEVEGRGGAHRQSYRAAWAVAAFLLFGIVLVLSARYVPRGPDAPRPEDPVAAASPGTGTAPVPATAVPPSSVTDDLRVLRNDILAIQETVKSLNPKSAPASRELPPLPMPRATRTPREEAQELLAAAREAEATGHLEEADRFLAHIQRLDPEFLEAYEARARLFEARDMRGEAAGQWSEILRRSIESPLYQQAVAERLRLSQLAAPATAADAPALRIAGVQQSRFQGTADYDEMRMLNVALAPRQPGVRLDREAVRVEVTFYDRDPESGEVVPTEARVEQEPLQAQAAWGQAVEGTVSATYVVPKGLRARQREAGQPRVFHGYRVQVFYHDQPQDEAATPKTLLATVAAPTP